MLGSFVDQGLLQSGRSLHHRSPEQTITSPRADRSQDVTENAELQFERLRAVVLVVACGHGDNEIAFRKDAN